MPTDRSKISSKNGYFSPLAYTPFNFSRTLPLINRNILFKIGDCCTSKMFFLHDQLYFDYFYSDKKITNICFSLTKCLYRISVQI